jgi:hypothetical protein
MADDFGFGATLEIPLSSDSQAISLEVWMTLN